MLWLHDLFWKDELELFVGVIKNRIHNYNYMIISTISWLNMAKEEYGKKKRKSIGAYVYTLWESNVCA